MSVKRDMPPQDIVSRARKSPGALTPGQLMQEATHDKVRNAILPQAGAACQPRQCARQ